MIAQIVYFDLLDDLDAVASKEFIAGKMKEFCSYDFYETSKEVELKTHYHEDNEARFVLEGVCFFNISGKQIKCCPGTYVEIAPKVKHSFYCNSQDKLKVLRFFGNKPEWEANYIDI